MYVYVYIYREKERETRTRNGDYKEDVRVELDLRREVVL